MNRQQLQQEIADLQKQLEEKQKALSAMPEKWRPTSGKFYVDEDGAVSEIVSHLIGNQDFGNQYATREQAEKAAKAMRAHNRLLAYVAEFSPHYSGVENSYVAKREDGAGWEHIMSVTRSKAVMVYMTHTMAKELSEKLNSGEVEL